MSDSLRHAFEDKGNALPESTRVSVNVRGHEWAIDSGNKQYKVTKSDDTLNIYDHRTTEPCLFCGKFLEVGASKAEVEPYLVCPQDL
jgi:hypothetical protein